mgnify:FL=1
MLDGYKVMKEKYIFDAAKDFETGSRILAEQFGQRIFPVRAVVVTSAFAIELYLKCLLLLTAGAIPKSHKLVDLYDALPNEVKHLAREKYHVIAPKEGELRDALLEHNETFVEWRYIFERQDREFSLRFKPLLDAATALYDTTFSFRPEWRR